MPQESLFGSEHPRSQERLELYVEAQPLRGVHLEVKVRRGDAAAHSWGMWQLPRSVTEEQVGKLLVGVWMEYLDGKPRKFIDHITDLVNSIGE